MASPIPPLHVSLPGWLAAEWPPGAGALRDDDARMACAIRLAQRNAAHGDGPFGALVYDEDAGRPLAPGVNLVLSAGVSSLHAEIVALSLAQRAAGGWDLRAAGRLTLYTSVAPCAMCWGALPWSGIARLVCGARSGDAEAIGFDEGDKPPDWAARLEARGIAVRTDLRRAEAAAVLEDYRRRAGTVYLPGSG